MSSIASPVDKAERTACFMAGVGLALFLAGAIALARYPRRNPARQA